jgi:hypothetical protein
MNGADALEQLEALVDAFDAPTCGGDIAKAFAVLDLLTAKVRVGAGVFDADGEWALDAAASLPAWLRQRATRSDRTAQHTTKTARRLRSLPGVAAAWSDGLLSTAQIDAIFANLTDRTTPLFAADEKQMLLKLMGKDARETARIMRHWAAHADALVGPDGSEGGVPEEPDGQLHVSTTLGGRGEISGHLDGQSIDVVRSALRLAERDNDEGETRTAAERRADALVDVCRHFLDHQTGHVGGRHRPHVNVVIDVENMGDEPGTDLFGSVIYDGPSIAHLLCDCSIHRVVRSGGSSILDFGHATRTISPALFAALVLRDGSCTFEGCDQPADRCEGHHVKHWTKRGETNLANLRLRCWHHHHLVHERGWHEKLLPDGTVESHAPDGRVFISRLRAGP